MIDVKLVTATCVVSTHQLSDDPSDQDLINLLGGGVDIATLGAVGEWEIMRIRGAKAPTLVLGAPPYLHADVKRRQTCSLSDDQIVQLVSFFDQWGE